MNIFTTKAIAPQGVQTGTIVTNAADKAPLQLCRGSALYSLLSASVFSCLLLCGFDGCVAAQTPDKYLASYVNPFVGTENSGDTYPGAQAPFGMVQFTPNLKQQGYYYNELTMHGFALTLMSGPGGDNGGTPFFTATTGNVQVDPAAYSYTYEHKNESASPGYYRVLMHPFGITAELTATTRCGMARFTYPAGQQANVLLPISYANVTTFASQVNRVNDHLLTGQTSSKPFYGPAKPIVIYFAMEFDQPFSQYGSWSQGKVSANSDRVEQNDKATTTGYYISYPVASKQRVLNIRMGISYVSVEGALNNLKAEMPDNTFDAYRAQTVAEWNNELRQIEVQGSTELHRRIFYTALYHSLLFPSIFDDVDGKYMGYDDVVRQVPQGHQHIYANFSGWDIYRTEWPLLTMIEPERAQDMAQSMVEMYKQLGYIDRWPEANRPTAIMNGNPLTICLVNIWNAGLRNFDVDKAYEAMMKASIPTSTNAHLKRYEPIEEHGGTWINADSNVSTAQEYYVSFAALGHMALGLNKTDDSNFLFGRALGYRTFFNPATGFFQPQNDLGEWESADNDRKYCEGDKWIYLWFVPHDVQGLVDLLGGSNKFEEKLDEFFAQAHYDATNEPDLQAPFFYDYINRPWKTQKLVAEASDQAFKDAPGGLASGGNDDLGEMSAWYILSQLGFYPVDPGVPYFETCTPRFPKAVLHLGTSPQSKTFTIDAPLASEKNIYIQSAELDGSPLVKPWFKENQILTGGGLTVSVGAKPERNWGANPFDRPYSLSSGFNYVPPDAIIVPLIPGTSGGTSKWYYTTTQPSSDWFKPDFSGPDWKQGPGEFAAPADGKPPLPWKNQDLWIRTTIDLKREPDRAALSVYHDDGIEVYLNGAAVTCNPDADHSHEVITLTPANTAAQLHVGKNILALHVRHEDKNRLNFPDATLLESH